MGLTGCLSDYTIQGMQDKIPQPEGKPEISVTPNSANLGSMDVLAEERYTETN